MQDDVDDLCARDVVAVRAAQAGYELAFLLQDAGAGQMLEVQYIRSREVSCCFKAEIICLVRKQWDGQSLVLNKLELAKIEAVVPQ